MSDYIIRGMAADKQIRFFAAKTKELVEKEDRFITQVRLLQQRLED